MTVSILSSTWQDSFWVSSDWMTRALRDWKRSLEGRLGCVPVRQIVQRDAMGRKVLSSWCRHGRNQRERTLPLTLDLQVQFIAEEACARVAREFDGRWSGALVVEIASGDILAWAQYPFNPNSYKTSTPLIYRNRLASGCTWTRLPHFKPLVMAAALEEGKITPNTLINCEGGKWENRNITIRDTSIRGILPASKSFALFFEYWHGENWPAWAQDNFTNIFSPWVLGSEPGCLFRKAEEYCASPETERSGYNGYFIWPEYFCHRLANGSSLFGLAE